jgi:hypothetical protein
MRWNFFWWKLNTPSPYGAGILPELVYALQGYNAFIADRVALPIDNYLDTVVYSHRENSTRAFIVHMLPDLAARLFRQVSVADTCGLV